MFTETSTKLPYETPRITVSEFEVHDILMTSGEAVLTVYGKKQTQMDVSPWDDE